MIKFVFLKMAFNNVLSFVLRDAKKRKKQENRVIVKRFPSRKWDLNDLCWLSHTRYNHGGAYPLYQYYLGRIKRLLINPFLKFWYVEMLLKLRAPPWLVQGRCLSFWDHRISVNDFFWIYELIVSFYNK